MTATEAVLRRDRLFIPAGIALLCLLSWYYLVEGAGTGMSAAAMSSAEFPLPVYPGANQRWSVSYGLIMIAMWWVMMIAMMLPSASPTILLYARVYRHNRPDSPGAAPSAAFLAGYLSAWLDFSLVATALQWLLEQTGLVHSMMMWSNSHVLTGCLLIAAGAYQFSALKHSCLAHCQSPAAYLSKHWQSGHLGALRMGFGHGIYCVGCCWSLMLLLFAGGVMNLYWIAGLAIFVLVEKLLPANVWFTRTTGALMIIAGGLVLL